MNPGGGPTTDKPGITLQPSEQTGTVPEFLNVRVTDPAPAQRRQQRQPHLARRRPQVGRVRAHRPGPPGIHQLLRSVREQPVGQAEPAHRRELVDLGQRCPAPPAPGRPSALQATRGRCQPRSRHRSREAPDRHPARGDESGGPLRRATRGDQVDGQRPGRCGRLQRGEVACLRAW